MDQAAAIMNLDIPGVPADALRQAARMIVAAGLSADDIALHLDAAAAVLCDKQLFGGVRPELQITDLPGVFRGATLELHVTGGGAEFGALNLSLAEKELEYAVRKELIFDIVFCPG